MKKILISFFVVLSALSAKAEGTNPGTDGLTDQQKEESYIIQCGSLQDVAKLVKTDFKDISDADLKELQETRQVTFSVMRDGESAIQKLLDQGNKDDIGALGVLLACGMIDQISDRVKTRGCINLENNEVVSDGPGIQICKEMIAGLKPPTEPPTEK